jgi:BirA family transcriptional regulator, biotin operon repressor / biotin---[acetyl-CoA-carboxylase] ligase
MPDAYLDATEIRASTFIRHVEIHETLGSTNDRAAELARDAEIELPTLVAARHQTAGRGRGNNTWSSAEGALTFSLLLDPASLGISPASWPQISLATAVAVCDAISDELNPQSAISNPQSAPLAIKWPNDIMAGGAKLCGILIESPGGPAPAKKRLIIGIGINVNNTRRDPHREAAFDSTSCFDLTGSSHDLQRVLIALLKAIEHRLKQHAAADSQLPQAWQALSWLKGKQVEVHADNGRQIRGICTGIHHDGALLVETTAGMQRTYTGSVRY